MVRSSLFCFRTACGWTLFRLIQKKGKKVETEVATRPAKRNTKQRKMDQESSRVEPRTRTHLLTPKGEWEDLPRDGKTTSTTS